MGTSRATSHAAGVKGIVESSRHGSQKEGTQKTVDGERTLTRNQEMLYAAKDNSKWIDMPLSTENTSRTHRSFFAVSQNEDRTAYRAAN